MENYILSELEKIKKTKENCIAQLNALSGAEEAFQKMLEKIKGEQGMEAPTKEAENE